MRQGFGHHGSIVGPERVGGYPGFCQLCDDPLAWLPSSAGPPRCAMDNTSGVRNGSIASSRVMTHATPSPAGVEILTRSEDWVQPPASM